MQLVLATGNSDKIREIKYLLDDLPITILSKEDFLDWPEIEETGSTLEENAIIKAQAIAAFTDLPALADDSGLEVDALDGAPGIYSARYGGQDANYNDNNIKLLEQLADVAPEKRKARFRCVIAICWEDGEVETVSATAEGIISQELSGREGFGYDPLFYYPEASKCFSEMSIEEKNGVSHRGKALQDARGIIMEKLNIRPEKQ